jgi:hypothetical protein
MMGTQHWIDFYTRFASFAAMARQYGFYNEEVDKMEQSFWEMCPFPLTYRPEYFKKKVKTNVSDF